MKRVMLVAVLLLLVTAIAAAADEAPNVEVFGGYSHFLCDKGTFHTSGNLNGWNASVAFNAEQYFGIVADFGGVYGTVANTDVKIHSFLFGPKFAMRNKFTLLKEKATPFAQALFGATNNIYGSTSANNFAMTLGIGLDYDVRDKITIRVAQAEYLMTRANSDNFHNFRYSGGIVLKLGKR
jgi:opacity protein-like surface antigen